MLAVQQPGSSTIQIQGSDKHECKVQNMQERTKRGVMCKNIVQVIDALSGS